MRGTMSMGTSPLAVEARHRLPASMWVHLTSLISSSFSAASFSFQDHKQDQVFF